MLSWLFAFGVIRAVAVLGVVRVTRVVIVVVVVVVVVVIVVVAVGGGMVLVVVAGRSRPLPWCGLAARGGVGGHDHDVASYVPRTQA